MLSSNDVSQMFAAQSGQFAQQNYYAQTIGVVQPGMALGGAGFMGPSNMQRAPGPMPPPGVPAPPPVYSYHSMGPGGPGYHSGNAVAGGVMSGLGGAAAFGGVGLGLAGMLAPRSAMGMVAGALDPVSAFLRAGPAMPFLNPAGAGTLMGGLGAAAGPLALGVVAAQGVQSFMRGGQQQQAIAGQLGQFNFLNNNSRTGQGFTRQDSGDLGKMIQTMGQMPELLSSTEELTRMLPKMRQMGVMQGVKDAGEFAKRFKETIHTIRDMSKVLGSTMEEASEFFGHSRQVGFGDKRGQMFNALQAQYTSGATGLSMDQVMQMQGTGAAMARQFGGRGRAGAQGVTNIIQKLQANLEGGFVDEGTIVDATGLEGDAGKRAAAEKMYQANLALTQSPAGQLAMAGMMRKGENGRYEIDQAMVQKLNSGEIGVNDLKANASRLGIDAKIAFKGTQGRAMAAQLAATMDTGAFVNSIVGEKGEFAGENVMNKYLGGNVDDATMELLMASGKGSLSTDSGSFAKRKGMEMQIRNKGDPRQMWERMKRKMHEGTFGQVEKLGGAAFEAIGGAWEDAVDDMVGRHILTLSKGSSEAFQRAMAGGDRKDLERILGAKMGSSMAGGTGRSELGRGLMMAGAGVAATMGPVGWVGGGAMMATGGAMELLAGGGDTDASAFVRSLSGSRNETGRSQIGHRAKMEEWTGLSGDKLDALISKSSTPMREYSAKGKAAARGFAVYRTSLMDQTEDWQGLSSGDKRERYRSSLHEQVSKYLKQTGSLLTSEDLDTPEKVAAAASSISKLGGNAAKFAEIMQAGGEGMGAGGGKDWAIAAAGAIPQLEGDAKISLAAASSDEVKDLKTTAGLAHAGREATKKMSEYFGTDKDMLMNNSKARDVMSVLLKGGTEAEDLRVKLDSGDVGSLGITAQEGRDLAAAAARVKDKGAAGAALGEATRVQDYTAQKIFRDRGGEIGSRLLGSSVDAVKSAGSAYAAFGGGTAGIGEITSANAKLLAAYDAANEQGKAAIIEGVGSDSSIAKALKQASAKGGGSENYVGDIDTIRAKLKKKLGAGFNEGLLSGFDANDNVIDPAEAKTLRERITNEAATRDIGGAGAGGSTTTEEKMLAALQSQTELLAMMVTSQKGMFISKDDEAKIATARQSAGLK
jgi:hypothetical protein